MKNKEIAELLKRMGTLLEIKGDNVFKIRAYFKASDNISALGEDIAQIRQEERLDEIPGVGKTMQEKIIEWLDTGQLKSYKKLTKEVPESLLDVVAIPSVGPKKAKLFFDELKVKSCKDLLKVAQNGKLQQLPGIQSKTVEKIIQGIKIVEKGHARINLGVASQVASEIIDELRKMSVVQRVDVAGSLRRGRETVHDVDILVDSNHPKKVMDAFVRLACVKNINAYGETKSSIVTDSDVQVDLRVVSSHEYGAALLYFTGSKNFNILLRQIAIKKKLKISEYGVFDVAGKVERCVASGTESQCFEALGLQYVPAELREDIGIKELFDDGKMNPVPDLLDIHDIQGEFHVHSTYSDGKNTIAEMVNKAKQLGYKYLAISDHSVGLRVARGVSEADLIKKRQEIDQLNKKIKGFHILFGSEVEIDSDGNLDYNEDILSTFDIVIGAIHSGFTQTSKQLTERLVKACSNKHVNIIAHPMGVHLGKREPYQINFEEVCRAAVDHNVYLEINSFPIRLDLDSKNVYFARKYGVKFAVNTDAHRVDHMDFMKFGVGIARRGWLTKGDVLNTHSYRELKRALKK